MKDQDTEELPFYSQEENIPDLPFEIDEKIFQSPVKENKTKKVYNNRKTERRNPIYAIIGVVLAAITIPLVAYIGPLILIAIIVGLIFCIYLFVMANN